MTRMKHEIRTCLGSEEGLSSACALPLESAEDESAGGGGCKVRAGEMAFSSSFLSFFYPPPPTPGTDYSRKQTSNRKYQQQGAEIGQNVMRHK